MNVCRPSTSWRAAAVAVAGLATSAAQAQDLAGAQRFVGELYGRYHNPDYSSVGDRRIEAAVYTPSIGRLLAEDRRLAGGEVGVLDFDPVCDCQDASDLTVSLGAVHATGRGQASVTATEPAAWRDDHKPNPVVLDLEWTAAGWRISDIHTPATPSLRKLLIEGLKAFPK